MSRGLRKCLLKGYFLGGKITECSVNPAQREAVGSPSRGRINWRESSLGVLASLYFLCFFSHALASVFSYFPVLLCLCSSDLAFLFSCYLSVSSLLFDSSAWRHLTVQILARLSESLLCTVQMCELPHVTCVWEMCWLVFLLPYAQGSPICIDTCMYSKPCVCVCVCAVYKFTSLHSFLP